jgi:hypothetical protein
MNIAREAGRRTMAIGIFVKGRVAKNVKIADSYAVTWSGEFENQEHAMQRLGVVVPISLLLIFTVVRRVPFVENSGANFDRRAIGFDRWLCGAVDFQHPFVSVCGHWLHPLVGPSRVNRCGDVVGVPTTT